MALLTLCAARSAGAVTVGDPAHPANLGAAMAEAYRQGSRDITLAPGTYDLPTTGKDTILMEQWADAAIHAQGVTLVFQDLAWAHRPVRFDRCRNVTWDGGTLRLAQAPDTQGRVKAVATDDKGLYCDWQVDAGYRSDIDVLKSTFNVIDPQSRVLKVRTGDFGATGFEALGPGFFRLRLRKDVVNLAVGDWLVTRAEGGSVLCHLDNSAEVTLKNLTLENGGFATIFETGGGGNHYLRCTIVPGPKPAGASEEQIVGCGADGFHSTGASKGPHFEDCDFRGVFLDDCIAIHGRFQKVIRSAGATLVLEGGHDQYAPGEPVRLSDAKGFFAEARCVSVKDLGGKEPAVQLTLDQSLQVPADAKANNPNHCGRGYRILNCRMGNTRSRGILVKGDDGLIEGCTIEGCGMSAISVGPEYYWGEANYCWNVRIAHNTIRQCDKVHDAHNSTIFIHGDGAIGNRNIVLEDNLFEGNYGQYILKLEWVDGAQLNRNRIVRSHELALTTPGNVVRLAHARHVKLLGNTVEEAGPFMGELVGVGEDVVQIENNTEAGIAKK